MKYGRMRYLFATMLACAILCTGCNKPIGGVDLTDVDIEEISSNTALLMEEEEKSDDNSSDEAQPTELPEVNTQEVTLLAVGDNLYHTNVIQSGQDGNSYNYDHIYEKMADIISSADYAIVNQETVFAPEGYEPSGYPAFLTPDEVADALVGAGFDIILHSTNHTADNGEKAVFHTLDVWNQFPDVKVIGLNKTKEDVNNITVVEKNGIKIALLNYTELSNKALPDEYNYMFNFLSESRLKSDISKAKTLADVVVVFPHWGTEYTIEPTNKELQWAQVMADAGADLVIGTHPHVIQPVEWVSSEDGTHNMLCYYSLGNFVSRQIEAERILEGMAKVTFSKVNGEVKISHASVTPLMMHYEKHASKNTYVMPLEQYTQGLADTHGVSHFESLGTFTLEGVKQLALDVFGSIGEKEIEIIE